MTWEYDKPAVMVGELFTWKSAPFAVLTGEDQMSLFSVPGLAGTDVLSQKATSVDLEDGMSLLVLEKGKSLHTSVHIHNFSFLRN